jgi:hypothetical protein
LAQAVKVHATRLLAYPPDETVEAVKLDGYLEMTMFPFGIPACEKRIDRERAIYEMKRRKWRFFLLKSGKSVVQSGNLQTNPFLAVAQFKTRIAFGHKSVQEI